LDEVPKIQYITFLGQNQAHPSQMKNTIYDIAKIAHLSPAAVSLALRDSSEISTKTREKVKAIARKLNYMPNSLARSLVVHSTNILGVVVHEVNSPFLADIFQGIQEEANRQGYMVLYNPVSDSRESAVRTFVSKQVDGLIILPTSKTKDDIEYLIESNFPFVLFSRRMFDDRADYVVCNNEKGAYDMVCHLAGLGHKRIAYITYPAMNSNFKERFEGYYRALRDNGLEASDELVFLTRDEETDVPQNVEKLLSLKNRPTAVFTSGDIMAARVIRMLKERNIRVPEDIAVTGFNNIELSELYDPPITTVDHFGHEMGSRSVKLLLERMSGKKTGEPEHVIIEPKLVVRKSCGAGLSWAKS